MGSFPIIYEGENYYNYLPVIFHDGLKVFSVKVELPMNLHTIIHIFKSNVWIALLVLMFVINICFFTIAKESPLLQYHCKWKKNNIPAILRILCFDSLIRFHCTLFYFLILNILWDLGLDSYHKFMNFSGMSARSKSVSKMSTSDTELPIVDDNQCIFNIIFYKSIIK